MNQLFPLNRPATQGILRVIFLIQNPIMFKHKTQKGSNEWLFILTQTHSMHILGEIPFAKI